MKISKQEVLNTAELARLDFKDSNLEKFTEQLGRILEYIEDLNELNTDDIEPTFHVLELSTPLREDKILQLITSEEALHNAPEKDEDFFVVPKIIEN